MGFGTSFRKALAASWAATMRVGLTSSTRMLREMSIASMMVDLAQGRVGRASASSTSPGGRCRRQALPAAARAMLELASLGAGFALRCSNHR